MQNSEHNDPATSHRYGSEARRPPRNLRRGLPTSVITTLAFVAVFCMGLFAGCQLGGNTQPGTAASSPNTGIPVPAVGGSNLDQVREAVANKIRPSVVQVNVQTQQGGGLGSGVIIDRRGYIVTNNHVIDKAQAVQILFFNGKTLPAQIVGTDPLDDLAVLKVNPSGQSLVVATLGDSSKLAVGQEVMAVGNPLGITQTVTNGIVSALGRTVSNIPDAIQTDAPINPGNSGGALVDLQGDLVGIPTSAAIDPEFKTPANGVGFAVPVNRVKFIVPQIIQSGKVTNTGRAALGVSVTDVDPVLAEQNRLAVDHGVLIVDVDANGPAAQAGLKPGDVIVGIGNVAVNDVSTLGDALLQHKPGDTVPVHIYRGNQQMTVNVRLGELKLQ
ncbi:MAG TPA: trypsin-like peptidase domain-containing protein [Ktedonobacteraceae bacterium]|jgi:S1-C subfamily serine protease|nr:trypsin-like peptidase domain-containing protein [Ktedonobacteraceae bacterium]